MKKMIALIALMLALTYICNAQNPDKAIRDTTINHVKMKIYEGSRGGQYIIITSKTGLSYKKYLHRNK